MIPRIGEYDHHLQAFVSNVEDIGNGQHRITYQTPYGHTFTHDTAGGGPGVAGAQGSIANYYAQQIAAHQNAYAGQRLQQQLGQQMSGAGMPGIGGSPMNMLGHAFQMLANPAAYGMAPGHERKPPKLENCGIKLGEIIAWRWWEYDQQGYLRSCTTNTLWPTSEPLKSSAEPNGTGPGIYAFRTEQDAINDRAGPILGRVMLWGTVIEYERGYTAEFAKIISLDRWIGAPNNMAGKIMGRTPEALIAVREAYGLPKDGTPLYAQGIETRSAKTEGLGPEGESPVARKGHAP